MCAHSHAWRGKILAPCILNTRSALSRIVFARHVKQGKYRGKNGGTRGGRGGEGGEGRTRESKSHFKAEFSLSLAPPFPLLPLPSLAVYRRQNFNSTTMADG